jgi:hypothetical protein
MRRRSAAKGIEQVAARQVLAVEEAVHALGKTRQAGGVVMFAGKAAAIGVGIRRGLEPEQVRHVVVGGVSRPAIGRAMEAAGLCGRLFRQVGQESQHILQEVAGHHRGGNRRVTHHLAGEHRDVVFAEQAIQPVEIVDGVEVPFAVRGARPYPELLIAVHEVKQPAPALPRDLAQAQVGDVAGRGGALVVESRPIVAADHRGQGPAPGFGQSTQQFKLFLGAEVLADQAPIAEPGGDLAVPLPVFRPCAVVGDQHGHPAVAPVAQAAITVTAAQFQQAAQALLQVPGAVRHRDHHHEIVTRCVLRQMLFPLPVQGLLQRQQSIVGAQAPEGRFQPVQRLAVDGGILPAPLPASVQCLQRRLVAEPPEQAIQCRVHGQRRDL